jgi:polyhydroxyalkanoate synthase subunit PhaC
MPREDHIVPWKSAFENTRLLGGQCTFVLGASGHIAGVVNPPHKKKRSFWSGDLRPGKSAKHRKDPAAAMSPDEWFDCARETPGSWWTEWVAWLEQHKGMTVAARRTLGNRHYNSLGDAPGEYVKVRI